MRTDCDHTIATEVIAKTGRTNVALYSGAFSAHKHAHTYLVNVDLVVVVIVIERQVKDNGTHSETKH